MSKIVGEHLQQARLDKGLTLEQVAGATFIKVRYLEAIERGDLESLPSSTQVRGFIRVFAGAVGLDPVAMLYLLDGPVEAGPPAPVNPYNPSEPEIPAETEEQMISREKRQESSLLVAGVGASLRHQRELLGLTLEDVERHTHLRKHYLLNLEAGSLDQLPSPVQGRGMLKNYAVFLGMDPEPLLLSYADAIQAEHAARQPEQTRPRPEPPQRKAPNIPSPLRRFFSGDLILVGGIIVTLLLFVVWGVMQIASARTSETPTPNPPSIVDVLAPPAESTPGTPEPGVEQTTTGEQPALTPLPGGVAAATNEAANPESPASVPGTLPEIDPSQGSIQVYASAQQRGWLRAVVDGEVVYEELVVPGTIYPFAGFERIEITTGNGAAISLTFNRQNLGLMGQFGEAATRIFTNEGIQTPTATLAPTGTPTPRGMPAPPAP